MAFESWQCFRKSTGQTSQLCRAPRSYRGCVLGSPTVSTDTCLLTESAALNRALPIKSVSAEPVYRTLNTDNTLQGLTEALWAVPVWVRSAKLTQYMKGCGDLEINLQHSCLGKLCPNPYSYLPQDCCICSSLKHTCSPLLH